VIGLSEHVKRGSRVLHRPRAIAAVRGAGGVADQESQSNSNASAKARDAIAAFLRDRATLHSLVSDAKLKQTVISVDAWFQPVCGLRRR
jgi:hypothetical protein